jgi:hypothetical protein
MEYVGEYGVNSLTLAFSMGKLDKRAEPIGHKNCNKKLRNK